MAVINKDEEERLKRLKAQEDLPPLPPLLAQILAQTRAKQAAKAAAKEKAEAGEGEAGSEGEAQEADAAKGPLLLEGTFPGLIVAGTDVPASKARDSDDSEDDGQPEQPPGPLDAARCRVHGPGFSGAAAGQTVQLTITARDSAGKRVREGGAHLLVMVEAAAAAGAEEEPEAIQAEVVDHGDGTYTATYEVPTKGNYQLHIEVNGDPLGDSPYPIFFSAPLPQPAAPAAAPPGAPGAPQPPGAAPALPGVTMPVPTMTAGGIQIVTADAIKAAQQAAQQAGGADAAAMAAAYPNLASGMQISLGTQLVQMGLRFPDLTPEQASRVVVIGGIPPHATPDALRSVFAINGAIRGCTLAGANTGCGFIEFDEPHEAAAALAMGGVSLMGQPLRVELATEAKRAADLAITTVANPYMALQAHQVQQFQLLQQQQTALAEQVLAMRAAARGRAAGVPPAAAAGDPQKSAALAAALALSKKMAGGGGAAVANGEQRDRSRRERSRSRDRSRRERSRSRERSRRERSRSRERSRRERSRSRDRKRSRSRERRRGASRGRDRKRSRSRDRKHAKHSKHSRRDKDKGERRERRRSRSGGRDGKRKEGAAEAMDVDGGGRREEQAAAAAREQQQTKEAPKDELEALLDELGD